MIWAVRRLLVAPAVIGLTLLIWLTLPLWLIGAAALSPPPQIDRAIAVTPSLTVLLVDDEEPARSSTAAILEDMYGMLKGGI